MCHKVTLSERQAEAAIDKAKRSKNPNRKECRYYYCKHCKGWHLTSHEYEGVIKKVKLVFLNQWKQLIKTG